MKPVLLVAKSAGDIISTSANYCQGQEALAKHIHSHVMCADTKFLDKLKDTSILKVQRLEEESSLKSFVTGNVCAYCGASKHTAIEQFVRELDKIEINPLIITSYDYIYIVHQSELSLIDCYLKKIEDYLVNIRQLSSDNIFRFSVVYRELLTNAILHGNEQNIASPVTVSLHYKRKKHCLSIKVTDTGQGFHIKDMMKKIEAMPDLRDRHRGLFNIKELADKVNNNGNSIYAEMRFV